MKEGGTDNFTGPDIPDETGGIPRFLKICLSSVYFFILIYVVFFARRRRHQELPEFNLIPFRNIVSQGWLTEKEDFFNFYTNLFGNIVLFLPVPFVLLFVFRFKKTSSVLLAGFLLSVTIELLQYIFRVGVSDIDDIILNTTGTIAGLILCKLLKKYRLI